MTPEMNDLHYKEFLVQCPHCKGKKGRIIKEEGKSWALCPNCGAALDRMNRVK